MTSNPSSVQFGPRLLKRARRKHHYNIRDFPNLNSEGEKFCLWCGKLLTKRRTRYCSEECSENFYHLWYSLFSWDNIRAAILKKDKYTCKICKKQKSEQNLEVHHIIPRTLGGSDLHWNLITLCLSCHKKETAKFLSRIERLKRQGQKTLEVYC